MTVGGTSAESLGRGRIAMNRGGENMALAAGSESGGPDNGDGHARRGAPKIMTGRRGSRPLLSRKSRSRRAVHRRSEPPAVHAQPARNLRLPHKLPATNRKITANAIRPHCGSESPKMGG